MELHMQTTSKFQDSAKLTVMAILLAVGLSACKSTPLTSVPVEDRTTTARQTPATSAPAENAAKPLPGIENAGKAGYYTVKPGDTLIRVSLDNGQNWRDLVKWNQLENANLIEVGQVLRVVPPSADPTAVSAKPVASNKPESRPLDTKPTAASTAATAASATAPTVSAASVPSNNNPVPGGDDEVTWAWPATGSVLTTFGDANSNGLSIAGKTGDPVAAAADGVVIYAGSGLRGYGNLIILKHNNTYLSAYAHNQSLLVKDNQAVKRGQKIAEMGASDASQVKLHFEIRRFGKAVDPAKLLPKSF